MNLVLWLKGKKTYLSAIVAVLYALSAVGTGNMTWQQAVGWFIASGGVASLRAGIAKVEVWFPYLEQIISALQQAPTPPTPATPAPTTPPQ